MTVRIGFDRDGVLADSASAYRAVETRLHKPAEPASTIDWTVVAATARSAGQVAGPAQPFRDRPD
jgi:hypothetical protein